MSSLSDSPSSLVREDATLAEDDVFSDGLSGHLIKRGHLVKSWKRRKFVLQGTSLTYFTENGGVKKGEFNIGGDTECEDSSLKPFCFTITTSQGFVMVLAAEDAVQKELWMEKLYGAIDRAGGGEKKKKKEKDGGVLNSNDVDEEGSAARDRWKYLRGSVYRVRALREARPQLVMRVIQAENLTGKDRHGTSDPYVVVTIGSTVIKTNTVYKDINPQWGEMFTFDFARSIRFAKVEVWDEDTVGSHDFLGKVFVPLSHIGEERQTAWFELGKRSPRSNVSGRIQLSVECLNIPRCESMWDTFRLVQSLPVFTLRMRNDGGGGGGVAKEEEANPSRIPSMFRKETRAKAGSDVGKAPTAAETRIEEESKDGKGRSVSATHGGGPWIHGVPRTLPAPEAEMLEDAALRVIMQSHDDKGGVFIKGALFLTNYRLIFVTEGQLASARATRGDASSAAGACNNNAGSRHRFATSAVSILDDVLGGQGAGNDLSTEIPIGMIATVSRRRKGNAFGLNCSLEMMRVQCKDVRSLSFLFRNRAFDEAAAIQGGEEAVDKEAADEDGDGASEGAEANAADGGGGGGAAGTTSSRKMAARGMFRFSAMRKTAASLFSSQVKNKAKQKLMGEAPHNSLMPNSLTSGRARKHNIDIALHHAKITAGTTGGGTDDLFDDEMMDEVEALDSEEGPAVDRMFNRLQYRTLNAAFDKPFALALHADELDRGRVAAAAAAEAEAEQSQKKSRNPTMPANIMRQISGAGPSRVALSTDPGASASGWDVYNPEEEFGRMGIPDSRFRLSYVNKQYLVCPTYPAVWAVPKSAHDRLLGDVALFRSKMRVPVLSWRHPTTNATIFRCAQPLVGLQNNRSEADEKYLDIIQFESRGFEEAFNQASAALKPTTGPDESTETKHLSAPAAGIRPLPNSATESEPKTNAADETDTVTDDGKDQDATGARAASEADVAPAAARITDGDLGTARDDDMPRRPVSLMRSSTERLQPTPHSLRPARGSGDTRPIREERSMSVAALSKRIGRGSVKSERSLAGAQYFDEWQKEHGKRWEPSKPYFIMDARPKINAQANQAAGKGFESMSRYKNCKMSFLGIGNIHVMRKSQEALESLCMSTTSEDFYWLPGLSESQWLEHIRKVMLGTLRIVQAVARKGISVLVHCSDGWDRTAQLSSLSMLLMDPYYRTLKGFQVLISKEWLSFGYKFADRSGYAQEGGYSSQERSPVFFQFIDCVFQCINQFPSAFEFNEQLLMCIAEHMHSGWFGNFLFNCERERNEAQIHLCTLSLWTMIDANKEMFTNPYYQGVPGVVVPIIGAKRLVLWNGWFLNWHDRIYRMAWAMENDIPADTEETGGGCNTEEEERQTDVV